MPSKSSASATATQRLKQDFIRLHKDPVPYITAQPLPTNILEWHYVVEGPPDTPYQGGYYHGKLIFPQAYPFKPPSIFMLTPSGRFKCNQRLCLSISDFHPDTWNPAWSVSTILTGLLSFMVETSPTLGSVSTTDTVKRSLAKKSLAHCLSDSTFVSLFPELAMVCCSDVNYTFALRDTVDEFLDLQRRVTGSSLPSQSSLSSNSADEVEVTCNSAAVNICIVAGVAAFAWVVRYVVNNAIANS